MKDVKGTIKKLLSGRNRYYLILALAAAGIILLILPAGGAETEAAKTGFDAAGYEAELEQRLTALISKIEGAGEANVVVTLESGAQSVYANSERQSSAVSTDDGKRNSETTSENDIIIIDSAEGDQPLIVTELVPQVRGVVVVCPGARDAVVREKIVLAVMTALNISASNVYVTY